MSNWSRSVFILMTLVALIVLSGLVAFAGYTYGNEKGFLAGERKGLETGWNQGFEKGKDKGFTDGQAEGKKDGYELGYDAAVKVSISSRALANPTYRHMKDFLAKDKTNSTPYVSGSYVCSDFATEVNNNAEKEGIRCAVVELRYPNDYAHSIVAFDTTDKGLVYIEPQFDNEVVVVVGTSYSRTNGYEKPPYSDIIARVLLMW